MIDVKKGVSLIGLQPEILLGLIICREIFQIHKVKLTITSVSDGKHGNNSLHYKGQAVDIRLPSRYSIEDEIDLSILVECREALGDQYDIVLESDHLHLEFDPKPQKIT